MNNQRLSLTAALLPVFEDNRTDNDVDDQNDDDDVILFTILSDAIPIGILMARNHATPFYRLSCFQTGSGSRDWLLGNLEIKASEWLVMILRQTKNRSTLRIHRDTFSEFIRSHAWALSIS